MNSPKEDDILRVVTGLNDILGRVATVDEVHKFLFSHLDERLETYREEMRE